MKRGVKQVAFEFFSIVVAVVLAMALTEWRQDYLNKKQAKLSFQNILHEVRLNLEELKSDSAKIARDLEFMDDWIKATKGNKPTEDFGVNFSFSFLSQSALEVARINQSMAYLSNEKLQDIAEIYATQDFYSENASQVFSIMGGLVGKIDKTESDDFIAGVQKFRFHLNLVFNTVRAYIGEANGLLNKYKNEAY